MSAAEAPPIADHALLGDGHAAALVTAGGSVDWCCLPRMDAGSCFGRLLDREHGGFFSIQPARPASAFRRYLDDTLVLETTFRDAGGEVRVLDCLTVDPDAPERPEARLLRVIEGVRGTVEMRLRIVARLDYGELPPWRRRHDEGVFSLTGGDDALIVEGDAGLEPAGRHDLRATVQVRPGERVRVALVHVRPERLPDAVRSLGGASELDAALERTAAWWRGWAARAVPPPGGDERAVLRSALTLKALANPATGAIAAAPTTSLPEAPGGALNWDYRFCWIRDSSYSARALAQLGMRAEADGCRRFVERSAAGSAEHLQIMYGLGGERRIGERSLDHLDGFRGARPVRVGNAASGQAQLDVYGEVMMLAWRWHERGHSPDDDYWRFLVDIVDAAAERWDRPDKGLWEVRGDPEHFVESKVMCWAALDRGVRLAEECVRRAPVRRWRAARDAVREAVERDGYDAKRGVFVRAFGSEAMDAAVLLLPTVEFVAWDDDRMVRTTDAIREELDDDGLLRRYLRDDGEQEGAFLACSFWLAEALARQGRAQEAHRVFDRATATSNALGLFSEEYDTAADAMLGNFPQGLTHLSHLTAAVALAEHAPEAPPGEA